MSTLTSSDLCIERSTTRLHAPPGGKSSFSLAHDEGMSKHIISTPTKEIARDQHQKMEASPIPVDNNTDVSTTSNTSKRVRVMQPPGGYSSFTLG